MTRPRISEEPRHVGEVAALLVRWGAVMAVVGLGGAAVLALATSGLDRMLEAYLLSWSWFCTVSLGALFFVLLQHATRAGWSVVVRRVAEGVAWLLPLLGIAGIPILLGMHHLYHWSAPEAAHDALIVAKHGWLNPTFFVIRFVLYFLVWTLLSRYYFKTSVAQDSTGSVDASVRMERWSYPGLVAFAVTINFAGFDLWMSLDPHWFSTIFGVYIFSGAVVGFLAMLPLLTGFLQHHGRLRRLVTVEHYHDMGKLLFAFVVFWAYIAFSQYMLIWYGNLPEETNWFLHRQTGQWVWVSLALLFGHFVVPFLYLISRRIKRRPRLLLAGALWVAVMHWLDLQWLIMPQFHPEHVPFGPYEVLTFVGLAGVVVLAVARRMAPHSLVPEGDPRLEESLAFENA